MNKLWQKESTAVAAQVERFTVGKDLDFDLQLARYDVQGSIAHVQMLGEVGLMQQEQAAAAIEGLKKIGAEIEAGQFEIETGVEDIHSQVELLLTRRVGDIGKMIHSGRSRNDQVAVDIKLFLKDACLQIKSELSKVFELLIEKSDQFKEVLIPGYTHLQVAMPSSIGLWLGAYAESLADDVSLLYAAYNMCNKNPLGSGAGYGSSFPLNRKRTTELLGFETLHWNSVYAQMSRGKTEKFVANAIAAIASSLARLSMDCCLYLSQNFGFISFPEALTTGSSIMPHKKNPDVFELIRGKCNRLQSIPNELNLMLTNLPSGYHRELQLTKEILFPAIETLIHCLQMMHLMMSNLEVKETIVEEERYRYMFSVEVLNQLVLQGVPFRTAYQQVAEQIEQGEFRFEGTLQHTHEGSIGNLCNEEIVNAFQKVIALF
ncbi:MAG: argininosuccinate lyase [Taibaiella sp.]|nr:argininosuccinate lyase [Taibaiella sp.]